MKKILVCVFVCVVWGLGLTACTAKEESTLLAKKYNATEIVLSDEEISVNGKAISTNTDDAVYSANDIVFYLEGQDFTYGEGEEQDEYLSLYETKGDKPGCPGGLKNLATVATL